jgi:hypothetical protein
MAELGKTYTPRGQLLDRGDVEARNARQRLKYAACVAKLGKTYTPHSNMGSLGWSSTKGDDPETRKAKSRLRYANRMARQEYGLYVSNRGNSVLPLPVTICCWLSKINKHSPPSIHDMTPERQS